MPGTIHSVPQAAEEKQIAVFISHIAFEQCLAETIKTCIDSAFDGKVEGHAGTGAGAVDLRGWAKRLEDRLFESSVLLVIASRLSVKSPWVFFETGFATARNITVIPICLPGLAPQNLPVPLVTRDALKLTTEDFGKNLTAILKRALGVKVKRGFQYGGLRSGIRRGLEDLRLKFRLLQAVRDRPRAGCTYRKLAAVVHKSLPKTRKALSELDAADYLSSGGLGYLPAEGYSLTDRGRELLRRAGEDDRPQPVEKEPSEDGTRQGGDKAGLAQAAEKPPLTSGSRREAA